MSYGHQYPLPVRTDLRCAGGEETHREPLSARGRLTSGSFWVTLGRVILINVVVGFIAGMIVQIIGIVPRFSCSRSSRIQAPWSTIILYGVISALQCAYSS